MKKLCFFAAGAALTMALTLISLPSAYADVPPPPVNQDIGLFDATINFNQPGIDRAFCQQCHVGSQVERHHALVTPSFGCFECHSLSNGTFDEFRECTFCHQSSPHHTTVDAQQRHCSACHGSIVADYDDGHYIPSYSPTSFTPLTGGVELEPGRFAGGCKACHMEDAAQGIASNLDTHHGTGLTACNWCHEFDAQGISSIRRCEDCHDVGTLHNIQADSNGDGQITPGTETGGYGHIGANPDCVGCHVRSFLAFEAAAAEPTIPSISSLSTTVVAAGRPATLQITGQSFTNTSGGETFNPTVEIRKGDEMVLLYPVGSFTTKELAVSLPETLEPGNYELRVRKNDVVSNKTTLTVAETVQISNVKIKKKTLVFKGSNFGTEAGEIFLDDTPLEVRSWKDKKIVARVSDPSAGQALRLVTASGAVGTADIVANEIKTRKKTKIKLEAAVRQQAFTN